MQPPQAGVLPDDQQERLKQTLDRCLETITGIVSDMVPAGRGAFREFGTEMHDSEGRTVCAMTFRSDTDALRLSVEWPKLRPR
jgi:hypothetical protein